MTKCLYEILQRHPCLSASIEISVRYTKTRIITLLPVYFEMSTELPRQGYLCQYELYQRGKYIDKRQVAVPFMEFCGTDENEAIICLSFVVPVIFLFSLTTIFMSLSILSTNFLLIHLLLNLF